MKKEQILNIPNSLTLTRVILALILAGIILFWWNTATVIIVFLAAMITDFLDGQIARRWNQVTEFGRKFDIIADRILMLVTVGAILMHFATQLSSQPWYFLQIGLILSREIISTPYLLLKFVRDGYQLKLPHARMIGKVTTALQAVAFPLILLNMHFAQHTFSIYMVVVTCICGACSAYVYIRESR